jgi:hypothetical protein
LLELSEENAAAEQRISLALWALAASEETRSFAEIIALSTQSHCNPSPTRKSVRYHVT